ncbi:MAG: Rrf2 family transcriptional regulator [Hespellia sp.]|nr:Rrf2 family transcriptional regulator [Hespellia sp.]
MKLSKKSRYGLRALVDLAVHSKSEHVALYSIAERNHISQQYLEQVFASLRRAGIVKSIKGSQGGYLLSKPSKTITAADILTALEGEYEFEPEVSAFEDDSALAMKAVQSLIIEPVNQKLNDYLTNLTLADLEKEYEENGRSAQDMYYI